MKKAIFGIFVVSMFALASCGGNQNEQQANSDSSYQAVDQPITDNYPQVDSLNATDTTATQAAK
ncbi:MAG: hypothetical protein ACUVQP_07785 [Bacteroidales bacterium]